MWAGLAVLAALLAGGRAPDPHPPPRVLVVTEARRYVHASIPDAVAALRRLPYRIAVVGTADRLTPARLRTARVVAFVSTTGELHASPRPLLAWIRGGGAFLGLHSVSATWRREPEFHRMLGATFRSHPRAGPGVVTVEDRRSAITRGLPRSYRVVDEFYRFTSDPRPRVHVLASHRGTPLVWRKRYGRGRVLVDSLGHFGVRWRERDTRTLVSGGLGWLVRR